MKTSVSISALAGLAISFLASNSGLAQIGGSLLPVVTIQATDRLGNWAGDTAAFTIFRSGVATQALNVYVCISGTATNGVDYQSVGNFISLPAGTRSNTVVINPINLGQTDVRSVTFQLCPWPLASPLPMNYVIGYPSTATVYIAPPGVTNLPPEVKVVNPPNNSTYFSPVNISLIAKANDPDGSVTNVEFFDGNTDLGRGFIVVLDPPGVNGVVGPAYFLAWPNVPVGAHTISAVATDNGGLSSRSDDVHITVQGPPPPTTNRPPVVRISSPPNGSIFHAPIDLPVYAYAHDFDGIVTGVEYFDGTNSIGPGHRIGNLPGTPTYSDLWQLVWSNAPVGLHVLTAVATDNSNAVTRSEAVNIKIEPPPPPQTNRPAIVTIVATDPVAIEGTNCWTWVGLSNSTPTWPGWWSNRPPYRIFTNCGPKNATFTVRRHGDTNTSLTVPYAIGGTASNGVDYVALSGNVTIAAGERAALISIVPIDDGVAEPTETVRLKLIPDFGSPPGYFVGVPGAAAAIIVDSLQPRPLSALLPGNYFHLAASGPDGAWFRIESSTDLRNWTSISTGQVVNGNIDFVDADAPTDSGRFYRAVPEPNPPPE